MNMPITQTWESSRQPGSRCVLAMLAPVFASSGPVGGPVGGPLNGAVPWAFVYFLFHGPFFGFCWTLLRRPLTSPVPPS